MPDNVRVTKVPSAEPTPLTFQQLAVGDGGSPPHGYAPTGCQGFERTWRFSPA